MKRNETKKMKQTIKQGNKTRTKNISVKTKLELPGERI